MFRIRGRNQANHDVELQPTPNQGASTGLDNAELGPPEGGHERGASGQSILSQMSVRLANLRARERSEDLGRIVARNQDNAIVGSGRNERFWTNIGSGPRAGVEVGEGVHMTGRARRQYEADLEASAAAVVAMGLARGEAGAAMFPNDELAQAALRRATTRRAIKNRREREEASTLLGPNVAHYFGSGSSSSGAVITAGQPIGVDMLASPSTPGVGAIGENGFAFGSLGRRVRLGSRGRARGASLSGLGQFNEGSTDPMAASLTPTASNFHPGIRARDSSVSLALGDEDGPNMAEGMDLQTLHSWIERSAGVGPLTLDRPLEGNLSSPGPAICTTLQAYVNLKRNTVRLASVAANADSNGLEEAATAVASPLQTTFGKASLSSQSFTHTLHFEYDCAAPYASVQVFIRASRKHGSWATWAARQSAQPGGEAGAFSKSPDAVFAQRSPPPHVLGWPVHATRLRRGFGKANKADLVLQLQLYAPPNADPTSTTVNEGGDEKEVLNDVPVPVSDANADGSLALDAAAASAIAAGQHSDTDGMTNSSEVSALHPPDSNAGLAPSAPTPAPSKKRKEVKEDKETLKLAIVVEALDEDGKPLREPNLQTTYMRLTSVPARLQSPSATQVQSATADSTPAEAGDDSAIEAPLSSEITSISVKSAARPSRVWSVQVEGQEAEIGQHRFQLQELYGLSTRPPPVGLEDSDNEDGGGTADKTPAAPIVSPADMEGSNGSECLICLSSPPTTLLLPCTHGLCLECAVQLRESTKATRESERRRGRVPRRKYACPVCRRGYTGLLHLSSADEKTLAQAHAHV